MNLKIDFWKAGVMFVIGALFYFVIPHSSARKAVIVVYLLYITIIETQNHRIVETTTRRTTNRIRTTHIMVMEHRTKERK